MLTSQGVGVIDAIPVLHMSVGASQSDAMVDVVGDGGLRSFYRERADTMTLPSKRRFSQALVPSIKMPRTKPTLRASKLQKLSDILTGFGASSCELEEETPRPMSRG